MLDIRTRLEYEDKEHGVAVVTVHTKRCFYKVVFKDDVCTVVGPGLEEEIEEAEDLELNYEARAVVVVLQLEEKP